MNIRKSIFYPTRLPVFRKITKCLFSLCPYDGKKCKQNWLLNGDDCEGCRPYREKNEVVK